MRRNCGNDQDHQECSLLEETHGERIVISVIVMLAGPKAVEVVNVRDS